MDNYHRILHVGHIKSNMLANHKFKLHTINSKISSGYLSMHADNNELGTSLHQKRRWKCRFRTGMCNHRAARQLSYNPVLRQTLL